MLKNKNKKLKLPFSTRFGHECPGVKLQHETPGHLMGVVLFKIV